KVPCGIGLSIGRVVAAWGLAAACRREALASDATELFTFPGRMHSQTGCWPALGPRKPGAGMFRKLDQPPPALPRPSRPAPACWRSPGCWRDGAGHRAGLRGAKPDRRRAARSLATMRSVRRRGAVRSKAAFFPVLPRIPAGQVTRQPREEANETTLV